jgi:hypothetical protein
MVHKLRKTMNQRDDRYTLEGMIEIDKGYFTIEASEHQHKTQKAGRGSKKKSNVMIMPESTVLENIDTGKIDRQYRYFKAKVLEEHKADVQILHLRTLLMMNNPLFLQIKIPLM